jgi:hypothetical protein
VGEAKRRQNEDPEYGKPNIVKNACQYINSVLLEKRRKNWTQEQIVCVFTNQELGCTDEEIALLKKEIPRRYENQKLSFWILPEKYANLSKEKASILNHLVCIHTQKMQLWMEKNIPEP